MEQIGSVNFRFSSRFGSLIGRNLISNPVVAVSELVKNAYDADADNIFVSFSNLKVGVSELVIEDDGEGMSYEDISTKWMVVGTDNKVTSPLTAKGRRKLGEKGIGRFSVERLSHKLQITTSKKNDDFALYFEIDWDKEEEKSEEFGRVQHKIYKIPADKNKCGTKIVMTELRDVWGKDNLLDIRKELNLIRPININDVSFNKYNFKGDFVNIELSAPDYLKKGSKIDSKLMSYHQAHLYGQILEDGSAKIRVQIKSNISINGKFIDEEKEYKQGELNTCCGPLCFEGFVFLKDKRLYRSLDVDKAVFSDYLDTFCGVKIYRDGFRILPFGDKDNDWLELNASRSRSPEHRLGTNNTIGIVYITRDDNAGLQDVLSRENMYLTEEYVALKAFVNKVFDLYTSLQLSARKEKERKKVQEGKKALGDVKKSVNEFSKQITELKETFEQAESQPESGGVDVVVNVQDKISTMIKSAESSLKNLETAYSYYKLLDDFKTRELQIYRNIATLGISAAMFGHEALNQTVHARGICKNIKNDYKELLTKLSGLQEEFVLLEKKIVLIDEKADFFRSYLQKEKQDRARFVNLFESLSSILAQHRNAFTDIKVIPEVSFEGEKEQYVTWGYEGDFDTIFANLITNAYKALKKERGNKYLSFNFSINDSAIHIVACNNGKVIEIEDREKIFQPLFSTYSDGTGLGLTIVQDTVLDYKGSIKLMDDYPETKFMIIIPIKSEPEEE